LVQTFSFTPIKLGHILYYTTFYSKSKIIFSGLCTTGYFYDIIYLPPGPEV